MIESLTLTRLISSGTTSPGSVEHAVAPQGGQEEEEGNEVDLEEPEREDITNLSRENT